MLLCCKISNKTRTNERTNKRSNGRMDKRTNEQKKEQANTITVIDGDPVIGTGRMVFKVEFTCYHGDEGTDR